MKLIDLTGRKFVRWTVLGRANHNDAHNKPLWLSRCECGVVRFVTGGNLRSGISQSCGCLKSERSRAAHFKHGHADTRRKGKPTRVYTCWQNMKQRCNNPNAHSFANYGGRGISYCEQWEQFVSFLAHNGEPEFDQSFDRINGNVRWATRLQQRHNRRKRKRQKWKW